MKIYLILFAFLFVSCGKPIVQTGSEFQPYSVSDNCKMTAGVSNDPESIEGLINYINALPKPLGADCFLKNLKRPLYVNATSSTLSAQPADGVKNPRIFIFKNKLIISVVPNGSGSHVLEFSELITTTRSIKGELDLPITKKINPADPFIKINTTNKTSCSGCHNSERFEHFVDGVAVYSSTAFKPSSGKNVMLGNMQDEHYVCKTSTPDSQRCRILDALLSHGAVQSKSFPSEMVTFLSTFGN